MLCTAGPASPLPIQLPSENAVSKAVTFPLRAEHRRVAASVYGYKTLMDESTGRLVGAHLVGPHADEVINLFGLAYAMISQPTT
jgi:pyruvate/2-oxoglutarate dehydrogenase complex dihydrolipoamide dehydrogenase (E3) component